MIFIFGYDTLALDQLVEFRDGIRIRKKKKDSRHYFWHSLYYTNWLHSKINYEQTTLALV